MKFFYFLLATFLILTFGVSDAGTIKAHAFIAKGNFYGRVSDVVTKAAIQGASVYFSDIKVGGTTDANGNFSFKNLPEGKHLIEISHIGYTSVIENIDIIGDTKKDYVLTEAIVENNAVIVTGVGTSTQSKKTPFQVSVLHKEELAQSSSTNIIEALAKKPG